VYADGFDFQIGKANRLREGKDDAIIACGMIVAAALEAAHRLSQDGIQVTVLDMHTVKPLDGEAVEWAARETGAIVTAEEHLLHGGLGSAVARSLGEKAPVPLGFVGIHDTYAESGKPEELFEKFSLTPKDIMEQVQRVIRLKR
jgi:transketolase